MTACPCAQELIAARARERLLAQDLTPEQIDVVLETVPIATHNQRGLATLYVGCLEDCATEIEAATLLEIAESSMSSEIYELMKRSDEVEVVEKAHRRPRFVEDCVREMVAGVVNRFGELDGREVSCCPPGEPRDDPPAQRDGRALEPARASSAGRSPPAQPLPRQTTLEQWLDGSAGAQPPA